MTTATLNDERRPPRIARGGWLDALRFIVGGLIILYHFREAAPVPLGALHPLFDRGYLLTNFFIIDSGYVLARIYADRLADQRLGVWPYMRQRLLRVVPAHLAVSLLLAALVGAAALAGVHPSHPEWFDWGELPPQVFLVQAYGVPGGQGWNAPTWTLSALLGCYLALPWLCRWLLKLRPVWVLLIGCGVLLISNLLSHLILDLPIYHLPLRYGFLRALPLFLLGVCVALFAAKVWISPRLAKGLGLASVAGFSVVQLWNLHDLASLGFMTAIILAAGAIPVARPSRLVEQLALMAFSMFLTNEVSRIIWFGAFEALGFATWPELVRWGVWLAGLTSAFVGAAVFRYGFDRPVQTWLNPSSDRRQVRSL